MKAILAFLVLSLACCPTFAQNNVTFQVNMKVKILERTFQPEGGDRVAVRGTFNGWNADTLSDENADSVYTKTISLAAGTIEYKFWKTLRGGIDWESDPGRTYTVVSGSQNIPVAWFDRDSVVNPPVRNVPVSFRVNMRVQILERTFLPESLDNVRIGFSFNGWATGNDTLVREPAPNDSIYRIIRSFREGDSIGYKYFKTFRGGIGGENVTRGYRVPVGGGTTPLVYFDDDSVVNLTTNVPVTFQVNMRVKILEGTFQPHNSDRVRVAGSFNGWNTNADTLLDPNMDSIYTKAVQLTEGSSIQYKFYKTPRGGIDWESGSNKTYTVATGGGTLPIVWFDSDSVVNTPITANIRWQVNMDPFTTLGWFSPTARDTMEVRGQFNNWGSPRLILQRDPLTTATYFTQIPYVGTSGDMFFYKFYMDLDSASAVVRFPNWNSDREGHNYEHPYSRGDGNRSFTITTGGNVSPGLVYFDDIRRQYLMLNTTDTCRITVRVNMGPATRMPVPFNPANDTVKLEWKDPRWVSAQIANQGAFTSKVRLNRASSTDSIWVGTFRVQGKAHAGMMHLYSFTKQGGGTYYEGPTTLGAGITYRVRFIQALAPNVFPPTYSTPLDAWTRGILPIEFLPPIDSVEEYNAGVQPAEFILQQNYPNPFNPSTRIRYSIPKGERVTLRVFDLLGREIATLVNEQQAAGNYIALFEAENISSGIYFYRLEAGKVFETKKMLLLR